MNTGVKRMPASKERQLLKGVTRSMLQYHAMHESSTFFDADTMTQIIAHQRRKTGKELTALRSVVAPAIQLASGRLEYLDNWDSAHEAPFDLIVTAFTSRTGVSYVWSFGTAQCSGRKDLLDCVGRNLNQSMSMRSTGI
jgi:hypothetical protein